MDASLHFDDETGRCTTIYCPYSSANKPRFFADEVERRIDLLHWTTGWQQREMLRREWTRLSR